MWKQDARIILDKLPEGTCARVFIHDECQGRYLNVATKESFQELEKPFNDRISSMVVKSGCQITVWVHTKFQMSHINFYEPCESVWHRILTPDSYIEIELFNKFSIRLNCCSILNK